MGKDPGINGDAGVFSLSDRLAGIDGIAVNDDGGEQVEPSHAVVLALARAETQAASFLLAYDPAPIGIDP